MSKEQLQNRMNRIMNAVQLKEGDRVPFMLNANNFYALHYGVSIEQSMRDVRTLKPALDQCLKDYNPDLLYCAFVHPIPPLERSGFVTARWPGNYHNLPENTPYQYVDKEFMDEDDYESYKKDPSGFLMTKVFSQKYKNFSAMPMLNPISLCGSNIFSLTTLGLPPVQEMLKALLETGQEMNKALGYMAETNLHVLNAGYPTYGMAVAGMSFDNFAAGVRGLMGACMDLLEDPEMVEDIMEQYDAATIMTSVQTAKMMNEKFAWIPLLCGSEEFMSQETYEKHYWPHLKKLLMAYIEEDIIPIVFCEGKYTKRLDVITDIPAGKVIYLFENVDLKLAKEKLAGHACFAGGMPTLMLTEGHTKQQVKDKVKEVMEICAPGGGYIMSNTLALDHVSAELMHTWREAVDEFGTF